VGALQVAAAEKKRVFAAIERRACGAANIVAELVAQNGAKDTRAKEPAERKVISGSEDSCGYQERVTGEEKANEQASFHKDDGANERRTARMDQLGEFVRAVERMKKVADGFQQAASLTKAV